MANHESLAALHDRLDSLWITYLRHLDAYTTAQDLLQTHLKSGFISLARANFNARDGVTRHGKDFYPERMSALSRVALSLDEDGDVVAVVRCTSSARNTNHALDEKAKAENVEEPVQQPSPPATPEPETETNNSNNDRDSNNENPATEDDEPAQTTSITQDPIRWFGVLVPRDLRTAQQAFTCAVDEAVAEAVSAAKRMRGVEMEVRRVRKEIKKVGRGMSGVDVDGGVAVAT